MLNAIVKTFADVMVVFCDLTGRTHYITGAGTELYMVRYIVLKTKFFSIFIHRFMRSDEPIPHDHPWNFLTYVISGGYTEQYFDRAKPSTRRNRFTKYWTQTTVERTPGSIRYRSANAVHYVEVDRKYTLEEVKLAPYTICFLGPRIKEWGFWISDTTYVDWREHLDVRMATDKRITGSE